MIFVITAVLTSLTLKRHIESVHEGKNLSNATFMVTVHEEKKDLEYDFCN